MLRRGLLVDPGASSDLGGSAGIADGANATLRRDPLLEPEPPNPDPDASRAANPDPDPEPYLALVRLSEGSGWREEEPNADESARETRIERRWDTVVPALASVAWEPVSSGWDGAVL